MTFDQSMPRRYSNGYTNSNSESHASAGYNHRYMKSTLGERVRKARLERKLSQKKLAKLSGLEQPTISNIETGRNASSSQVVALARTLNKSAQWLADEIGPESPNSPEVVNEPSGDYIAVRRATLKLSAGVSGFAIDYQNDDAEPLFFRADWFEARGFAPDQLIALRVNGASMEPGLYDGDTVVVNIADTRTRDGEVFAVNYEGELVIKRLKRDAGEWWLASDNHDKRRFPDKRLNESVILLGRVIQKSSERI